MSPLGSVSKRNRSRRLSGFSQSLSEGAQPAFRLLRRDPARARPSEVAVCVFAPSKGVSRLGPLRVGSLQESLMVGFPRLRRRPPPPAPAPPSRPAVAARRRSEGETVLVKDIGRAEGRACRKPFWRAPARPRRRPRPSLPYEGRNGRSSGFVTSAVGRLGRDLLRFLSLLSA